MKSVLTETYNLDTSTCIDIIRNKTPETRLHFERTLMKGHFVVISSIALHELAYGAGMSSDPKRSHATLRDFLAGVTVLEFDADDAMSAGEIRSILALKGKPIGPYDTLIAGQALRRNQTMVTANIKEFSRVNGLTVESWRD